MSDGVWLRVISYVVDRGSIRLRSIGRRRRVGLRRGRGRVGGGEGGGRHGQGDDDELRRQSESTLLAYCQ
jgi:hypothetical protein